MAKEVLQFKGVWKNFWWIVIYLFLSVHITAATYASVQRAALFPEIESELIHKNKTQNYWQILLENDIRLTKDQEEEGFMKAGILDPRYRWPGGIVVYSLDPNFDQSEIGTVKEGMFLISSKTCIKFKERSYDTDFVQVYKGEAMSGCYSQLGRVGGEQELNLGPGCLKPETVAHEFIHALGFFHEHTRPDRDDFITILWQNVQSGKSNRDLSRVSSSQAGTFNVPYDYLSIMHYDELAYSKNRKKTIIAKKDAFQQKMGKAKSLTGFDAQKINNMYQGYC